MPGDENHPNTQPAGNPAGAAGGVQQTGGGVLDPTLVAIGNLQTVYNANGGPPAERGSGRGGADPKVQDGGSRHASGQNLQDLPAPPPPPTQSDPSVEDLASREGKFPVLDRLEPVGIEEDVMYLYKTKSCLPKLNGILMDKIVLKIMWYGSEDTLVH